MQLMAAGFVPSLAQSRQQHGGQNSDNRNDDEKFNQGECGIFFMTTSMFGRGKGMGRPRRREGRVG
jgi:hypothetical protein